MEKIHISVKPDTNSTYHIWFNRMLLVIALLFTTTFIHRIFFSDQNIGLFSLALDVLTIVLLFSGYFINTKSILVPEFEANENQISVKLPKGIGISAKTFDIAVDDITGINNSNNQIEIITKDNSRYEIELSNFSYAHIQVIKEYFTELETLNK